MRDRVDLVKGIHPGKIIGRKMRQLNMTQRLLAKQAEIPYQTINAIILGKRGVTIGQSVSLERVLGFDDGFLSVLQTYYERKQFVEREQAGKCSGVPNIRRILFWDADFDKINWYKHKDTVIKRVMERGNSSEIAEIKRYYNE